MPNVPISCLPPSRVDTEVQGLKIVVDCPQPGGAENAGRENAGHENAGHEIAGMK